MLAPMICLSLLGIMGAQGSLLPGSCPWPCPAQCAPMCSPLCCRGYGRQQTFPSYRGASFYPQAAAYLPRPKPRQTFVPPPPPPPPPPRAPLYFSPQANQQMSFYSQPRQPLPLPPPPPPPPSCPGACSKNCYPACTKSCCNPPPPPPCPWYCPKSCYPQCGEACCKPKPPPMPLYLKRSEMNAVACEEHKLKLRCPNKYDRIVLYSTFYGRKEDGVCKHDFIPSKGRCVDQEMRVNKKVYDLCSGENKCLVSATNGFLANGNSTICPGLYKYLKVVYRCHQHPQIFKVCPLPCHNPYRCFPHCTPDCCTPPPPPAKTCPVGCSSACAPLCTRSCCNPAPPPQSPPAYMPQPYNAPQPQQVYMPPPPSVLGCPAPCSATCAPVCSLGCCFPQAPQYNPGSEVMAPAPSFLKIPTAVKPNQPQFPRPQPYQPYSIGFSPPVQACPGPCSNACAPACSPACCFTKRGIQSWRRPYMG